MPLKRFYLNGHRTVFVYRFKHHNCIQNKPKSRPPRPKSLHQENSAIRGIQWEYSLMHLFNAPKLKSCCQPYLPRVWFVIQLVCCPGDHPMTLFSLTGFLVIGLLKQKWILFYRKCMYKLRSTFTSLSKNRLKLDRLLIAKWSGGILLIQFWRGMFSHMKKKGT